MQSSRNTNRDYLSQNFIEFKKYLYNLSHDINKKKYLSMYDLGQKAENENNYISAFRIIGYIENNLKYYNDILFPKCHYFSEYDFDILPKWQMEIYENEKQKDECDILFLLNSFKLNKF